MPLTRYRVRSEYGLADPELYGAADKDDPEALLEGVAMAGLVGVLRQLGDLAEFAAEIFHDLHEEVMATAARGHGLIVRVQQLEAEFPPIEKALLSQTSQSSFYYNSGVDWHPSLRSEQNLIARGDLPRFVMDSYEESRGPPRLFLLDKFDVAGAGACLKRYTDPSFFKVEAAASGVPNAEIPREKKNRRVKKKGSRWRNGETTPEVVPASHTKLQQLFLEERIENGFSDPARLVKLKKRHLNGSVTDSRTGISYMEKFVDTPKEHELDCETSIVPVSYTPEYTSESGIRILEISTVSSAEKSPRSESACSSPLVHLDLSKPSTNGYGDEVDDSEIVKVHDTSRNDETSERSSSPHELQVEKQLVVYGEGKPREIVNGYESDDVTSEVDNYMDALASMESEMETDNEHRPNSTMHYLKAEIHGTDSEANEEHLEHRTQLSDSQSVGNFSTSDDGNNSFKRNRSSFSYSDSPISLVENTHGDSDSGAKISPSTETCGSEIVNEHFITKVSLGAKPQKLVVSPDLFIREENTPSHGEASSSGLVIDLHSSQLHLDPAASSTSTSLDGPKVGGPPTDYAVSCSKVPDTFANETNLFESIAVATLQINDNFTKMPESYLVDEPESVDPNVISGDSLHMENTSELVSEIESRHSSVDEDFQMRDEIEASNKISVSDENEPRSITQKQLGSSTLPVSKTSFSDSISPNNVPAASDRSDVVVPKFDDSVTANGIHTEDFPPTEKVSQVDSPQTLVLEEPRFPDSGDDFPHVKPVSAEARLLFSKEEPNNKNSGPGEFEEMGSFTIHEDADGGNVASLEHPSTYLSEPGDVGHENLEYVEPEVGEVDHAIIRSSDVGDVVDKMSNDICFPTDVFCSPSENLMNLPETVIGTVVTHQKEAEYLEGVSLERDAESETAREDCLERDSIDANFISSLPTSCNNDDSPLPDHRQNSFSIINGTNTSASVEARDQELESVTSYHFNAREDDIPLSTSFQPGPPADHVGAECLVVDEAHPEFPSKGSEKADNIEVNQPSFDSSSPLIQKDDYSESPEEDLPSQSSMPEFSSKPAGQEVHNMNQALSPFDSTTPTIAVLPEAPQVDLGEMPPLPPLPPMQWRMGFGMGMGTGIGNFQQKSHEGDRGLFPPLQPLRAYEEAEVKLTASQSGSWNTQNSSFPLAIREDKTSQHVAEPAVVNFAHPPYSMQLPTIVSYANSQYDPFLQEIYCKRQEHDHIGVEEEKVQSASSSTSPTQTAQSETTQNHDLSLLANQQPLTEPGVEAGLDATTQQQSLKSSEEHESPFVSSRAPPTVADEEVRLGLLMPEGKTRWLSNHSDTVLNAEAGNENGNQVPKIPRPRNPLIDAVNAHGTSKLRKVTERTRPQLGPKADERDSLLEQIRNKSFSLKPTTATRPSIGPAFNKTNLKVAAILEKANAIRQSLAGSDDEDDEDNWD